MTKLEARQHPDKTFIGRISRGFDFLGWHLHQGGLASEKKVTIKRFKKQISRLYEQGTTQKHIEEYIRTLRQKRGFA